MSRDVFCRVLVAAGGALLMFLGGLVALVLAGALPPAALAVPGLFVEFVPRDGTAALSVWVPSAIVLVIVGWGLVRLVTHRVSSTDRIVLMSDGAFGGGTTTTRARTIERLVLSAIRQTPGVRDGRVSVRFDEDHWDIDGDVLIYPRHRMDELSTEVRRVVGDALSSSTGYSIGQLALDLTVAELDDQALN